MTSSTNLEQISDWLTKILVALGFVQLGKLAGSSHAAKPKGSRGRRWLPPLKNGTPRKHVYWHSVMWLTRDGADRWVIGPRSEIAAGSLSDAVINAAPV